jgi:hypothetical protein
MPVRTTKRTRVRATASVTQPISPFQQQIRPKWCWAACTSMVLEALSRPKSQCLVAGEQLGQSCCGLPKKPCVGGGTTTCDKTLEHLEIDALLASNKIEAKREESALSAGELEAEIAARRPVLVWLDGGGNPFDHVVLVVGKHDENMFLIADPCLTSYTFADHGELLNGRNGWTRTWRNIRKAG